MSGQPECIFCKIVEGDLPSTKLYEDDLSVVFMDINPWTKGHCLVVSKQHAATFFDLTEASALGIMRAAYKVAPAVKGGLSADGLNLLQSNGRAAWQQVDHFHLHLIPRWFNDPLVPPVVPEPGDPSVIAEAAEGIKKAL